MKNSSNKFNGIRRFVKEKGYYIVLLLCAVAVGISGYFLLKDRTEPTQEPTVSVTDVQPRAADKTTAPAVDAAVTQPGELPTESGTKKPVFHLTPPVQGDALTIFAADHLAYNETTRDWRTHEGVDLAAALGQDVCAAAAGTVEAIYEDERLGMTVVLSHSDGYTTHYSNLTETVSVKVGDTVSAGSVLGTVGQTACVETAVAPHMHFAVYRNGSPLNPEDYWA